jgi:hypothetical protein
MLGNDDRYGFNTAEAWHPKVHKRNVRLMLSIKLHGFVAIAGFSHYHHIRFFGHNGNHAGTKDRMIIGNQNSKSSVRLFHGPRSHK